MAIMNSQDAISSKAGKVFMSFGPDGDRHEIAEIISFEAMIEYTKADVNSIGRHMKGNKVVGGEGTGSMAMHFHRPEMRRAAAEYVKKGIAPAFTAQVDNADMTSRAGRQSILFRNIVPDQTLLAKIDSDSDEVLTDETDFTFDDFDILDEFGVIQY